MSLLSFDHVQLAMPAGQEDSARAFYGQLLGLSEKPKPAEMAARGGCWFENQTIKVHLGVDPDFRPATKAHPAIAVGDFDQLVRTLTEAGCKTRTDVPVDGRERIFVFDPFGNRLELIDAS